MRGCWLCGRMTSDNVLRGASRSLHYNYVLMMALSMAQHLNVEEARVKAEQLGGSRKLCHDHVVCAAQYLLAEVVMAGNQISHFDDPKAQGRTAYLNIADIPQELITALNRTAEGYAVITGLDVLRFLNDALKRYYATPIWPVTEEVDADAVESGGTSELPNESLVADEEDQKPVVFSYSEKSTNELECDDMSDDSSTSSEPPLEKTDPAALDQFYLVRGRKLVQLFRFCPRCGNRLNESQLSAVGTEAVVSLPEHLEHMLDPDQLYVFAYRCKPYMRIPSIFKLITLLPLYRLLQA
ncbi:hypothetical protein GCK32_004439 [Trichostrongylus colubriformis]|uniref:Uncharacterized protein n=1 Tax=Trichostrongylus colubriformis TaxID=6319 RepID=A0AAN8F202_TRICO